MPRPRLRVSNVGGLVGALVRQYQGLKGAKLKRKRTLARYLDAVNYPGGVNASADPATHYPDELWIVDRQAERNKAMAEFELASPMDLAGVMLPRRQVVQGFCPWAYRGPDCGYTGAAVARADDSATTNMGEDDCGKRLSSCKLRQWPNRELAFGGFPGVGVLRNV
jgi:lambda family phage minor tail protein L